MGTQGQNNTGNHLKGLKICQLFRDAFQAEHRVGLEVERLSSYADGKPFQYSSQPGKPGAETLLRELGKVEKAEEVAGLDGRPIGLNASGGKVSLEPGSALEYSTNVAPSLTEIALNVDAFEERVSKITDPWGLHWLPVGVHTHARVEDIELIPSERYKIMTEYLGKKAKLGTAMMRLTSSVQVNVDYTSEENAVEVFRTALSLVPLSYALFANSPYFHGKKTGYLSYRSEIWRQTDPERTGLVPEAFEEGFDLKVYTDILARRPLMFATDNHGKYVAAQGATLEQIAEGKLPHVEVNVTNCWNAVREFFSEVRLKPGYVEVRAIDGQTREMRYAAAAFWMGALYSPDCRRFILKTLGSITSAERYQLWIEASKMGPNTLFGFGELSSLAEELLPMVETELKRRNFGEEKFLEPLKENLDRNTNPALEMLSDCKGTTYTFCETSDIQGA